MEHEAKTRVAVITGASSGIGKEAAKALVKQGWKVIGIGRNPERCEAARAEISRQASGDDQVIMLCADLALMSDVERAAASIAGVTDRVDALLNNAGGLTKDLQITAEGNENTFASNHLGHFLLTNKLLPLLRAAAAASPRGSTRVVNVSSKAHEFCDGLDWDDLQMLGNFSYMPAYCRAKLANLLFTRELSRRLAADGIVVHAMHPGVVASNFFNHGDDAMQDYLAAQADVAVTPAQAADTLVWLSSAQAPGESTGEYFYERNAVATHANAADDAAAQRLWRESEKLVASALAR